MDPRQREQIDACRPLSDDLSDPEMASLAEAIAQDAELAEVFRRSQLWDARVTDAMAEVVVPAGLADRLCSQLLESQLLESEDSLEEAPPEDAVPDQSLLASTNQANGANERTNRRSWMIASAAALLLAGTVGVFFANRGVDPPVTVDHLRHTAHDWYQTLSQLDTSDWNTDLQDSLLIHPLSENVDASVWACSQLPSEPFGEPLAYDITPRVDGEPEDAKAYLVVTEIDPDADLTEIMTTPPRSPNSSLHPTSNASVAVWRTETTLYVLILEGGQRQYRRLIKRNTSEWT